jgi:hypothetical protein
VHPRVANEWARIGVRDEELTGDGYELKIIGYHTTDPDWTAGVAVDWKYDRTQARPGS